MSQNLAAPSRSRSTRILHWLVALTVIAQLGLSLVMQSPGRNRPGDALFEVHEKVGIVATALLLGFWLWSIVRSGETRIAAFFPWLSPKQLRLVWHDARNIFGSTHEGARERPFASAVHGLGLIVATVMAASGLLGYFVASARWLLGIHEAVAPLMWAYLVGHVGVSIVHQLRGDRVITSMLSLSDRN